MATSGDLADRLQRLDGAPYPAYKDLRGRYDFGAFMLGIDEVQGDPFAAPSRFSVHIDHERSGLECGLRSDPARRTGTENFLADAFARACEGAREHAGSGKSGMLAIDRPGQVMLRRTCVAIGESQTIVRFAVGLPANGRRILGRTASRLLTEVVPEVVERSMVVKNVDREMLRRFADTAEDAEVLRAALEERGLVAFVANGAVLARASGVDDRPLRGAVPFESPDSLEVTVELPHAGRVTGMGLGEGVTLIAGGGYHGKSTLLNALERGVYNHRPSDGRELVVTRREAVKIRAEDGRGVREVDLSPFINNLPGGQSTRRFDTDNASGSTSQAANIMEALESGCRTMLIDEDISATNFLIRDARMQQLIAAEKEPITPLVQRVRSLWEDHGVSTVLVLGGSGDYFEVAERVIAMDHYRPKDVTAEAKAIAAAHGSEALGSGRLEMPVFDRVPDAKSLQPRKEAAPYRGSRRGGGGRSRPPRLNVKAHDNRALTFGRDEIDLSLVAQILEPSQVRAIGAALVWGLENDVIDGRRSVGEIARELAGVMEERGLSEWGTRDLAEIREHDLAAAINRLRSLRMASPN